MSRPIRQSHTELSLLILLLSGCSSNASQSYRRAVDTGGSSRGIAREHIREERIRGVEHSNRPRVRAFDITASRVIDWCSGGYTQHHVPTVHGCGRRLRVGVIKSRTNPARKSSRG